MKSKWGPAMTNRLKQRLADLDEVASLEDAFLLPGRCHPLKGNRAGQFAMDLVHPMRLVFVPMADPSSMRPDGGIDCTKVTGITILAVEDYH